MKKIITLKKLGRKIAKFSSDNFSNPVLDCNQVRLGYYLLARDIESGELNAPESIIDDLIKDAENELIKLKNKNKEI